MANIRKRKALPAKLTPPTRKWIVPRQRLLAAVAGSDARVIWIHGRPGSGKTLFAARLSETRRGDRLWVQLDADDRNPAVFLEYLRMALPRLVRTLPMPDLAAPDLPAFVRRFSRLMFAALREDSLLVLEDFHEIGASPLAELLPVLCAEAGAHVTILITSREPAPPAFTAMRMRGALHLMDAGSLQFSADETASLLAMMGVSGPADQLCREADGWAAGITLLAQAAGTSVDAWRAAAEEDLFAYFARQVFENLDADGRKALERISLLSRFTSLAAVEMAADHSAAALLQTLMARNLFVDRRIAKGGEWYQLHPLFSRFLSARLASECSEEDFRALQQRAAEIEARMGNPAAAVKLFIACDDLRRAETVILEAVVVMLPAGRDAELAEIIGTLLSAGEGAEHSRWLYYWLGVAHAHSDAAAAFAAFKHSHALALEAGDRFVAFMSAASTALAAALYERALHELQPWAEKMREFHAGNFVFPDPNFEIAAMSAALAANIHCDIEPIPAAHAATRLEVLLSNPVVDPRMQLVSGAMLLEHHHDMGSYHRGMPVCQLMIELAADPRVTEYRRARTFLAVAIFLWYASVEDLGDSLLRQSERHVTEALRIAETCEFQDILAQIKLRQADLRWRQTRYDEALAAVEEARSYLSARHPYVAASFHQKRCMILLAMNRVEDAMADVQAGLDFGERAGLPPAGMAFHHWLAATARFRLSDYAGAEASAERAIAHAPPGHAKAYLSARPLFKLRQALLGDHPDKLDQLGAFFAELKRIRGLRTGMLMAPEIADACVAALDAGIEVPFVTEMIRIRGFRPPATDAPEQWPWPIRLRVLGNWSVEVHGQVWTPAHKTPKKPLDILKYLAVSGRACYEGIPIEQIVEDLWPDPNAEDPRASFDIALHRLRKLLAVDNALFVTDGKVSLSADLVWTDAAQWERTVRRLREGQLPASDFRRAIDLYRGAPLSGEVAAWAMASRERLRARFIETVIDAGRGLENGGDTAGALALYSHGIDLENLAEPIYRGVMRCCLARGEIAEGLRAYRRCRDMLSVVLSVAPTAETEALRDALKAQAGPISER
ncbi:MAG: hypothetical protein JNM76_02600 [Betaproteobacteria bacterium]|nr:hypothetical protein [Betaproteobacteria bacterium]